MYCVVSVNSPWSHVTSHHTDMDPIYCLLIHPGSIYCLTIHIYPSHNHNTQFTSSYPAVSTQFTPSYPAVSTQFTPSYPAVSTQFTSSYPAVSTQFTPPYPAVSTQFTHSYPEHWPLCLQYTPSYPAVSTVYTLLPCCIYIAVQKIICSQVWSLGDGQE